jgi:hypothetical protein
LSTPVFLPFESEKLIYHVNLWLYGEFMKAIPFIRAFFFFLFCKSFEFLCYCSLWKINIEISYYNFIIIIFFWV